MSASVRIRPGLWAKTAGMGERARLLAFYLSTNDGAAAEPYGLYQWPLERMAQELGQGAEDVRGGLALLRARRIAYYDEASRWLWVVDHAADQLLVEPTRPLLPRDNLVRAVNKWWAAVPANCWLDPFYEYYWERLHLRKRRIDGRDVLPLDGPVTALALPAAPSLPAALMQREAEFERLWQAYPDSGKISRKAARHAWLTLSPRPRLDDVMEGLERWYRSGQWARGYIPNAAKWIKEQRWEATPAPAKQEGQTTAALRALADWSPS